MPAGSVTTASTFPLSELPDHDLILAVATDLAVDPSFVEKDWHATQLIATVAEHCPAEKLNATYVLPS